MNPKETSLHTNQEMVRQVAQQIQTSGDYDGRFPLPIFTSNTLPIDQAITVARSLVEGAIIDWDSEIARSEVSDQITKPKLYSRLISAIVDNPGKESAQAFEILLADMERFTPDISLFASPALPEWANKMRLSLVAGIAIKLRSFYDHGQMSEASERFLKATEQQVRQFSATLDGLTLTDLPLYIRFEDLHPFANVTETVFLQGKTHISSSKEEESLRKLQHTLDHDAESKTDDYMKTLYEPSRQSDLSTWKRLKTGWGWQQIHQAISILPTINDISVRGHTLAALESNLLTMTTRSKNQVGVNFDTRAIAKLLEYEWGDTSSFEEIYPHLAKELETQVESAHFSVPRKKLPSTAITLLEKVFETSAYQAEFLDLLIELHEHIKSDPNLTRKWLLAMLAIRQIDPNVGLVVNHHLLPTLENLPETFHQTLLNKRAGKLWLTPNGKLRLTPAQSNLASAYPIHTSSYKPESVKDVKSKTEPKVPEKPSFDTQEVRKLPFVGEVGIIPKESVRTVIGSLLNGKVGEDDLLETFSELAQDWQSQSTRDRNRLYLPQLNASDQTLQNAQKYGLSAVHIMEDQVFFIVKEDVAVAKSQERTIPAAFHGSIDQNGMLLMSGCNESFIGEPQQIWLNNLALKLATQRSHLSSEALAIKSTQRELNEVIAGWNRSPSRTLPKVGYGQALEFIALRIPSFDSPVLVGIDSSKR